MNDATMQRVRRWYDALAHDSRPHWDDVEVVVRLGVSSTAVLKRLLWEDPASLAQHFDTLQAVIHGSDAEPVEIIDLRPAAAVPEVTPASHTGGQVDEEVDKQTRVRDWFEGLRREGFKVDPSQDVVEQVAKASTLTQLRGLVPRELLKRRGDELAGILAMGRTPPPVEEGTPAVLPGTVDPDGFAPFSNWSTSAQTDVRFSASAGAGIGLSWDAPADAGRVDIYRVTARDDYEPASPDESRLIAATYDTTAVDTAVFSAAKRHVAVWLHRGRDERAARAAQAELWAVGTCVLPVRDVRFTVVDGQVAGTWSVAEGVDRVEVLRLPETEAITDNYNLRYRLGGDQQGDNLLGFEDHPDPGNWVYRMYACALHNGQPLRSPMIEERVTVTAVLPAVLDLEVVTDPADPDLQTLSWTKPALPDVSVEIHRHLEPLQAGIESRVLDREAMNRYGLTELTRANHQQKERDGRMAMEQVRWPAGAPRIHFTAVTRSWDGSQFQIGNTVTRNRAGEVTHAVLVERVDEQFVTFAWPEGADFVEVYQGAQGAQVDDVSGLALLVTLSRQKYERLGGAHLPHPLPSNGCSVHIVGVSYQEGMPSRGAVCSIDYPGLVRIQYKLERRAPEPVKTGLFGRKVVEPAGPPPARLRVQADREVESVTLALVHHSSRLPMFPGEGRKVLEGPVPLRAGEPIVLKEQLPELQGLGGFVRLFVVVPETQLEQFAVLDPPIEQLRCD